MKPATALLPLLLSLCLGATAQGCAPPANLPAEQDPARIQQLALALLPCLASPDPLLRDATGLQWLQIWARSGRLRPDTLQRLRTELMAVLDGPPDAAGVHQPFAALALAEVARVDRKTPFLSPAEREELVVQAVRFLSGVRDYRGFVPGEGWRHGVAHGADLALQLGANDALTGAQRERLLGAINRQVLADHRHAYRFGEGARLARAAQVIQLKAGTDAAGWQRWLAGLLAPVLAARTLDETALTDVHNLREFLWPLFFTLSAETTDPRTAPLARVVGAALLQLPPL
ncbi:MAG: DUF2785 domain-containing protein [Comamonadaceae bacterium]|nr:DUF2785 domain-containing protein [Comamonadaceae bacterium]